MRDKGEHSARADALHAAGTAAYRSGDYAAAKRLFAKAHAAMEGDGARAATALSDYGAACSALSDHAAARSAHEAALEARRKVHGDGHPDVAASLHNLGAVLRALGAPAAASACHQEALHIWEAALGPSHALVAKALASLGVLARECGDTATALRMAQLVLDIRTRTLPEGDAPIGIAQDELGKAQSALGEDQAALESWGAALAILISKLGEGRQLAPLLNNCGVAARALGELTEARGWFTRAVAADPALAAARHNLAAVLARLGEEAEAARQRGLALERQCVFIQIAARAKATLLIPSLAQSGNVPLDHILPDRDFTRIWWFIGRAGGDMGAALPPYDLAFNGIGDADMLVDAGDTLAAFISSQPGMRVLNHPDRIALTRRDRLGTTLAGIDGLVVPLTCRICGPPGRSVVMDGAERAGLEPPLLLRPAGAHGGEGVQLIESWADWDGAIPAGADAWYLSRYHGLCGDDGHTRKYRVVFVNRVPFPYHLAISRHWLVHYFSAEMEAHAWKLAEEKAFLADPQQVLGERAWTTLASLGARLDLDFCGVDFALLPDGRLLVFEANATMLVHPERETGRLAFKNPAIQAIVEAMAWHVARPAPLRAKDTVPRL